MPANPPPPPRVALRGQRPRRYPPPVFPPRKPALFATTPPVLFLVVLGLLALGLVLRRAAGLTGLPAGIVEAFLGAVLALWAFATLALVAKIFRRPGVVIEDLRVLPGRAGLAAATIGMMAAAEVVVPYAPRAALVLALLGLALHGVLALLLIVVLLRGPREARGVNPTWHLSFAGFIMAALPLTQLGFQPVAAVIFWASLPVVAAIWGLSLAQVIGRIPPAPLRPLLALHLAPAGGLASVAVLLDQPQWAASFTLFGAVILLALLVSIRWVAEAGFSPLWGAFPLPLAVFCGGLIALGGLWAQLGLILLVPATPAVLAISWQVLKLWPGGRLATRTNAAEA